MALVRAKEAFDNPDWIFEVKYDGFRALAYVDEGKCELVSRRKRVYKAYQELTAWIGKNMRVGNAILDGELVCIGRDGRPVFQQLLHRRGKPYFYTFDLLWLNGEDFRPRPLMERKAALRKILPADPSWLLYADHTEGRGKDLFRAACLMDLEGIVAKWKHGPYLEEEQQTNWIKILNPTYSQMQERHEQFAKHRQLWLRPRHRLGQAAELQRKPVSTGGILGGLRRVRMGKFG